MTRRTTTIYLPCENFEVEALIGPSEVASPIERLTLQLVAEGIESLRELDGLIGLGPRPTLDLVFGLWRRGYLSLDPASGQIAVTAAVRDALVEHRLDSLSGGELTSVRISLMQELVGGAVLSAAPMPFTPPRSRVVPPLLPAGSFKRASPTSFRLPIERAIKRMTLSGGREFKVFQASLPLGPKAGDVLAGNRSFFKVEVASSQDPDSGRLEIHVIFPAWLPLGAQSLISNGLAKLAERYPRQEAVRKLREEVEERVAPTPTQPSLLADSILSRAGNLEEEGKIQRFEQHAALVALSEAAVALLGTRADAAQRLVALVGGGEIDAAVSRAIEAASSQLVLVCPWVRPQGFRRWYRLLKARIAAQPDLRVFMFWGIGPASVLPTEGPIVEWFEELRRTGRFWMSPRPSKTHAKLAVADARHAVVSSFNFMSSEPGDVLEVGVEAVATQPTELPSPIALELLRCALDMCPEHSMALALMTEPEQWGLVRPPDASARFVLPVLPEEEDGDADVDD